MPRVLTPESRGCFELAPSADFSQATILWDPSSPLEWFVVENRQSRPGFDEGLPSNGLVVSWVAESADYWSRWPGAEALRSNLTPAVLSAAAATVASNPFVTLPMQPGLYYQRWAANAAFRSGTYTLPRGDGLPSRFRFSVRAWRGTSAEFGVFCIE